MTIKEFIDAGYQVTVKYNNRTFWSADVNLRTINTNNEDFVAYITPLPKTPAPTPLTNTLFGNPHIKTVRKNALLGV